ncbi:MAG: hypothetical protein JWQ02_4267 [Capsulimonas sp.]|jgi:hypothetical protein|nr:hypothetical protein [Capsulimonas sp.]
MTKETLDNLQGAALLIPFLILCYFIGVTVNKFQQSRYKRAFAPIAPIIEGVFHHDGSGDSGVMAGSYRGHKVIVRITMNTTVSPSVGGGDMLGSAINQRRNLFEIELTDLPGAGDWSFQHRAHLFQKADWGLSTSDNALLARLNEVGTGEAIQAMMHLPAVWYSSMGKNLQYREDIHPSLAPRPDRFQQQLDLLVHLAEINARVNPVLEG